MKVTPSSSTCASFCFPLAIRLSDCTRSGSSMSTLRNPAPSDMIWNPPLSVNVGPGQFMKAPRPPASATMSGPGCR